MIICRKRNFIFLRVTKTASTSITHHLLDNIPREEIDHIARNDYIANLNQRHHTDSGVSSHATLGDLIQLNLLTHVEIKNMRVCAIIRDPIDRFLSAAHSHHVAFNNILNLKSNISNEEAVDLYIDSKQLEDTGMALPQFHWLEFDGKLISNIYPYQKIEQMFIDLNLSPQLNYYHRSVHRTTDSRMNVSNYCKRKIIAKYAKDWNIWQSFKPL